MTDLHINLERLKQDIKDLSEIGRDESDFGIYRLAYTEADLAARRWLMDQLRQAELETWMDGAANVYGRLPGKQDGPTVLVGSHTDTVPAGGALDGALGVLAGMECLRVIKEAGLTLRYPIELVDFADEEGRFGGMLGSQAMVGDLTPEDVRQKVDPEGVPLTSHMEARGLDPSGLLEARRDPNAFKAYLELHIEQGPVLDHEQVPVGVVDGIAGIFKWQVQLIGKPNHAGATPMRLRQDAFSGLAEFSQEIPRVLSEDGSEDSRATIGKVDLLPGFPHTIAGEAQFTLVVRDPDPEVLDNLEKAFRKVLSAIARMRRLQFRYDRLSWIDPVQSDEQLVDMLENCAQELGFDYQRLTSGAGHDAQFVSRVAPTAMIFVPSKDGVSHAPGEWTDWHDIEKGANLLLQGLLRLAEPKAKKTTTPKPAKA